MKIIYRFLPVWLEEVPKYLHNREWWTVYKVQALLDYN